MKQSDLLAAVAASVDAHSSTYTQASDAIWDHPEVNFHEDYSAEVIRAILRENGFSIEDRLGGMPNAFRAEYGSGKPVIAYLGEFDALSSLSQEAGCAAKKPITPGAPGHGCGHNLLGVGALGAAIALKEMIERGELSGTVFYFGTPAEETGSAKTFLARDGFFSGIDAMLTWHPWDYTGIWPGGSLANVNLCWVHKGGLATLECLKSVTVYAAEAMGLQDRIGTLEAGKDADIVVWDGNPMDYYGKPEIMLINGEQVSAELYVD